MRTLLWIAAAAVAATGLPALAEPAEKLEVAIISGGGARNHIRQEHAAPLTVEVRDAAGKPVPDATVTAVLPARGTGARFAWGSEISTKQTGSDGRVTFGGMRLRALEGEFPIRIVAAHNGMAVKTTATQFVSAAGDPPPAKRWTSKRTLTILGIAGAGAAAAIVAATVGGDTVDTPTTPGSYTPGLPVFSGPR